MNNDKTDNKPIEQPKEPVASDSSVLSDIKKENLEMQAELQKREEFIRQREELKAREMLAGRSRMPEPIPEEVSKKKAAIEFWKGTDIARAIERHG